MPTNIHLPEADIRRLLDEYFRSGFTLKEFCMVEEHDETILQSWVDKYFPELNDDGFIDARIDSNLKDEPKKPGPG